MDDWEYDLMRCPSTTHSHLSSIIERHNRTCICARTHTHITTIFVYAFDCNALQKKAIREWNHFLSAISAANCLFVAFITFTITIFTQYYLYLLISTNSNQNVSFIRYTYSKWSHTVKINSRINPHTIENYLSLTRYDLLLHTFIWEVTLKHKQLKW